ncbi:MAG: 30S ribosomal protein S19 [archaeon]|jgi:small subunit ribosomal protein S19|nr:30S ribosomal protein S19 [Euryarchaeota archaeon]MDP7260522.1 30S ribosomal protein S19 [archaeon]|tara:strand:+ start:24874 stop:25260 length:387 start_codon:yes stop_codon:yes gene_type:complete
MARKEFKYRGLSLEELQKLSVEEFMNLAQSRTRRSLNRGLKDRRAALLKRSRKDSKAVLRTHCRDMIVLPEFIGRTFAIYNGKEFVSVKILPDMIGMYFGELSPTRRRVMHTAPGKGATRASKFVSLK